MLDLINVSYDTQIPNNVGLSQDRKVLKALEKWHPGYLDWWNRLIPQNFQESMVYLRTAVSVDPKGWAKFDYVKMPEYRWGVLLAPQAEGRLIPCGEHAGQPAWQEVPGEYRNMLKRLIVIQGDTEPGSVEQQRFLGLTAPSLYDMRNLFQVNVEEGRHLWAMVYLLQKYFGKDGREEADEMLIRSSGSDEAPRMLGAFNEETPDWLSFFMFTYFTDRDGKMQLESLAQSGFDPLSRTCRFMLTEEAHHMFVGETGVGRIIQRTCEAMNEAGITDPYAIGRIRDLGVIDLDASGGVGRWNKIIQKTGIEFQLSLPHEAFHRQIGIFASIKANPEGNIISDSEWNANVDKWLPTKEDGAFIQSLMVPCYEPGKFAGWIAPPKVGIDNKPGDFEYVKLHMA
ncbi:MAG: benzoyl-CoA 2,3-epoxidase subunit BoxB [Rhodobacteraceae bacterium]|nr:benzoyl-CoA 2,3-epoxidase subunit BoxB [Paracoccaceae bacterium]